MTRRMHGVSFFLHSYFVLYFMSIYLLATAVGSKAIRLQYALYIGAFFDFLGAVTLGNVILMT